MKITESISEIRELENIEEHQSVDIATLVRSFPQFKCNVKGQNCHLG